MTATEDFYAWGRKEPIDKAALDRRFLDLHLRLLGPEGKVIAWESALLVVEDKVLAQTEAVIGALRTKLISLTELGWLTAGSSSSITLVENGTRSILIAPADRDLFVPGPFAVLTRAATPDDFAVIKTQGYDRASGQFDFVILSRSGAAGPHADWIVASIAGSTLAQLQLLEEARAIRDVVAEALSDVQALAVIMQSETIAAAGSAGAAATSASAALGSKNAAAASATAAAIFDPANFYTRSQVDAAFYGPFYRNT